MPPPVFSPGPGYAMQNGFWQTGRFVSGLVPEGVVHLCCSDYIHVWASNGGGDWFVYPPWRPWAGYGIQIGSWYAGDFNGDSFTDFFHSCCLNYGNIWYGRSDATFDVRAFVPPASYVMNNGSWAVLDYNGDGNDDLVHLCCANYVHVWISMGGTAGFDLKPAFYPRGGAYAIQNGAYLAGYFNLAGGWEDLMHICCGGYVHIWLSNGTGTFRVQDAWTPGGGYAMLNGSWHAADISGDGKMELLHACCGDYAHTWLPRDDGIPTFDTPRVTRFGGGYCMRC